MKKFIIISCIFLIAAGCKKSGTVGPKSNIIFGKWELRSQIGGWVTTITYQPGNGNILKLNSDYTYIFYKQSQITTQGTFQIVKKNHALDSIYYNHANGDVIQLKNDTLIIGTSIADGP
jgi:hypothetical protein